jgi:hypothetical protein
LEFTDTLEFSAARFTATLDTLDFQRSDGSVFTAASPLIDILLLPFSGNALVPGIDFRIIVMSDITEIPEPASWVLLLLVLAWAIVVRKAHANQL